MYTTQSKMISRAIWVEKKHVWKINLQKNGVRKSFYSSVPGDKGRKICAQNATSWLSGACPFSVSERTTVDTVFERYLQDKALETTNIYTIRNRYNNHIKPIIGKVPVMLLTKQDLKRVIYTAYRKHNLSQKSLKNIDAVTLSRKKAVPSPAAASTSQRRLPPRTGRASSSGICISLTLRWPNLKSTFMT